MQFRDIAHVRKANKEAGKFWFQPETMQFFNSRIVGELEAGRYFLTSEQYHSDALTGALGRSPKGLSEDSAPAVIAGAAIALAMAPDDGDRAYTIREALPDCSIETVGAFQQYSTLAEARVALAELVSA